MISFAVLFLSFLQLSLLKHADAQQCPTTDVPLSHGTNFKTEPWEPATKQHASIQDLKHEYGNIFEGGNSKAASHLWSTFLLDRADQMNEPRLDLFFSGFCAVSGSPLQPMDFNRYRLTLPHVNGKTNVRGYMYSSFWSGVCDAQDFIRIDTKTVTDVHGVARIKYFTVIGNPCDRPEALQSEYQYLNRKSTLSDVAPEVKCNQDGSLSGATLSDHGYIIIGMFFYAEELTHGEIIVTRSPVPGRVSSAEKAISNGSIMKIIRYQDEREYVNMCADRAMQGYTFGLAQLYRRILSISPIPIQCFNNSHGSDSSPPQLDPTIITTASRNGPIEDLTCEEPVVTSETV